MKSRIAAVARASVPASDSLADDMLTMAEKVDQTDAETIAAADTCAALHHLMESLEAAHRAAATLRAARGTSL